MIKFVKAPEAITLFVSDYLGNSITLVNRLSYDTSPRIRLNLADGKWEYSVDGTQDYIQSAVQLPFDSEFSAQIAAGEGYDTSSIRLSYETAEVIMNATLQCLGSGDIPSASATPQMFGATGNGVADDTEAIQRCLAASSNIYFPPGNYRIDQSVGISLYSNQTVILDSAACIVATPGQSYPTSSGASLVRMKSIENVVFRGGSIAGDRTTRQIAARSLVMTAQPDSAIQVYFESTEGGYYLYFLDGETKHYITLEQYWNTSYNRWYGKFPHSTKQPLRPFIWNSKLNSVELVDSDARLCIALWNTEKSAMSSYSDYFFTRTFEKEINKRLFPVQFYESGASSPITAPVVGVPLIMVVNQLIAGEQRYFNGSFNNTYNNSNCIQISSCKNVTVENVDASEARWDSLAVGGTSEDITVRNCNFHDDGRSAMSICGCLRFKCFDTSCYNLQGEIGQVGSAIDLEPDSGENRDCLIEGMRAWNNRQGIIINRLCWDTTVRNCEVNTLQNYLNEGDSIIQNCVIGCITCKSPGSVTISGCVLQRVLLTRTAKDVTITNCTITANNESSNTVCLMFEGLGQGSMSLEDFHAAQDAATTRLTLQNCILTSKVEGTTSTGGYGRESVLHAENTSLLSTKFYNCVFNFRNCINNHWRSENIEFSNCVFNFDSAGQSLRNDTIFALTGRVNQNGNRIAKFDFIGNTINIGNAIFDTHPMSAKVSTANLMQSVLLVDESKAQLGDNAYNGVMKVYSETSGAIAYIINNISPQFSRIFIPENVTVNESGNITKSSF